MVGCLNATPDVAVEDVLHDEHHAAQQHATQQQDEGADEVFHSQRLVRVAQCGGSDLLARTTQPKLLPTMKLA